MNIEEYRALKAEQEQQAKIEQEEPTVTETEPVQVPDEVTEQPEVKEDIVSKVKLGDEEYELSQIEEFKNGYLRQEELVKERMLLEQQREELEHAVKLMEKVRANPELSQQFEQEIPELNPQVAEMQRMRVELEAIKIEKEIADMKAKYADFDVDEVAQVIQDKGITDLETAYQLSKVGKPQQAIDIASLKEQLKAELLKEIEASSVPQSLVSSNGGLSTPTTPTIQISDAEIKIAKNLKMTPEEYVRWRDK